MISFPSRNHKAILRHKMVQLAGFIFRQAAASLPFLNVYSSVASVSCKWKKVVRRKANLNNCSVYKLSGGRH